MFWIELLKDYLGRKAGERLALDPGDAQPLIASGVARAVSDNPLDAVITKGIESALHRAIGLWFNYPHEFRELMANGMRSDYSWARPGQDYLNIYEHIRHR